MNLNVKQLFDDGDDQYLDYEASPELKNKIEMVHYTKLMGHKNNRQVDHGKVLELVDSILEIGLTQPPNVTPNQDGEYTILAGHHRVAAITYIVEELHKQEYELIRCVVSKYSELDAELVLIDTNLKVNQLSPYDKLIAIGRKRDLLQEKRRKNELFNGSPITGKMRDYLSGEETDLKPTQVGKYLSIYDKADEELLSELEDNKITIEDAYKRIKTPVKAKDIVEKPSTALLSEEEIQLILSIEKYLGVKPTIKNGILSITIKNSNTIASLQKIFDEE